MNNNYYYESNSYNPYNMNNNYNSSIKKWSQIPYSGQSMPYTGIEPGAGEWTMNYFKDVRKDVLVDNYGRGIKLDIKDPRFVNFDQELKEVQYAVENITEDQRALAKYWASNVPAVSLGSILTELIKTYKINPVKSSKMLEGFSKGLNDAFVITWYLKYLWDVARPNQLDSSLKTPIDTPQFPSYPSGHSVISAAIAEIISFYFPQERDKILKVAEESSISRLYGGVHFMSDLTEGMKLGKQIGNFIVEQMKRETDSKGNQLDLIENIFLDAPIIPNY